MGIEILCTDGQMRPVIRCDRCGELIERVEDGGYWYHWPPNASSARPRFTHKGECFNADIPMPGGGGRIGDGGLDCFMVYLRRNCATSDLERDEKNADRMTRL